jgi:hypothetical protein
VQLQGSAESIGNERKLLGSYLASTPAVLRSVAWQSYGHGDTVFVIDGDWNPVSGRVHPHRFDDVIVLRQSLGEDDSPIEPITIPPGATVRFLARALTGADSAAFVAEIDVSPPPT